MAYPLLSNEFIRFATVLVICGQISEKLQDILIIMSESAPGRPMKFPYTFSAKLAQFPMKFYVQNQWIWKYWMIGIAVSLPVFYKIHKLANSPENVSKWAEIRRKEAAEHH